MTGKRRIQSHVHPENNQQVCTHILSHRHGGTNEYTNATASLPSLCGQEEHSRHIISECFSSQCDNMSAPVPVTTPHCIDIHQLCSSLGHSTTMPKIWHWKNNSPAFTCLETRPHAHAATYIHMCAHTYGNRNTEALMTAGLSSICCWSHLRVPLFKSPSVLSVCLGLEDKLSVSLYVILGILPRPPAS